MGWGRAATGPWGGAGVRHVPCGPAVGGGEDLHSGKPLTMKVSLTPPERTHPEADRSAHRRTVLELTGAQL